MKPVFIDLSKVAAHFAISSMFEGDHVVPQYCYSVKTLDYRHAESGTARLALGRSRVTLRITREAGEMGLPQSTWATRRCMPACALSIRVKIMTAWWRRAWRPFPPATLASCCTCSTMSSMACLTHSRRCSKTSRKRILDIVLSRMLQEAEASYHTIYERHGPLLRFLKEMGQPVPDVLRFTAEFVLNNDLKHTFETDPVDFVRVAMLMEMVKREGVKVDEAGVRYAAGNSLTRILRRLQWNPHESETLERANALSPVSIP